MSELEQPPPGVAIDPPQVAPVNLAQGSFRVLLWLIPAVFAVASYWGIQTSGFGRAGNSAILAWLVLNLGFIGTTGWFDAMLSRSIRRLEPERRTVVIISSMVGFFVVQLLLIPVLVGSALFAFRALGAR